MQTFQRVLSGLLALFLFTASGAMAAASVSNGPTPPRLGLIEGQVSFWRPGTEEWVAATLNTPLAPGDALYAGENANLELQIGNRAFVRAGERTQLSLVSRQRHTLRFRVVEGQASFDLRALPSNLSIEVETPNAQFTIDRSGYYRLIVDQDTTLFNTRRGGRATVVPADGKAFSVASAEELIVEGITRPSVETYAVPELDDWDRWNYARTEHLLDALSSRYLPPDVYGAEALDQHGSWRVEPTYGTVWVPAGLPVNWAPYSRGRWIMDPYYGWTWIDDAPWGWAPFHYGRWVFLNGFWAWAPGPVAVRSVYSPALVGFFNSRGDASVSVSFGVGAGVLALSWVALSWGEPVVPWWGRPGFIGVPTWSGWHGPRTVNTTVINRTTVTNVTNIYQNTRVTNAIIAVPQEQFGRVPVRAAPIKATALTELKPITGALPVKPMVKPTEKGMFPSTRPGNVAPARSAVTQQAPKEVLPRHGETPQGATATGSGAAASRFVTPPKGKQSPPAPFGTKEGPERATPSLPPRYEDVRRPNAPATPANEANRPATPFRSESTPPRTPPRPMVTPPQVGAPQRGEPMQSSRPSAARPQPDAPQRAEPPTRPTATPPQGGAPQRGEPMQSSRPGATRPQPDAPQRAEPPTRSTLTPPQGVAPQRGEPMQSSRPGATRPQPDTPQRAEPPARPSVATPQAVTPQRGEASPPKKEERTRPFSKPESAPPATPPLRDMLRREDRNDKGSDRSAAPQKDRGQEEERPLPGKPANRMSPRRQGAQE